MLFINARKPYRKLKNKCTLKNDVSESVKGTRAEYIYKEFFETLRTDGLAQAVTSKEPTEKQTSLSAVKLVMIPLMVVLIITGFKADMLIILPVVFIVISVMSIWSACTNPYDERVFRDLWKK